MPTASVGGRQLLLSGRPQVSKELQLAHVVLITTDFSVIGWLEKGAS
jgi:hypothetical protein